MTDSQWNDIFRIKSYAVITYSNYKTVIFILKLNLDNPRASMLDRIRDCLLIDTQQVFFGGRVQIAPRPGYLNADSQLGTGDHLLSDRRQRNVKFPALEIVRPQIGNRSPRLRQTISCQTASLVQPCPQTRRYIR